MTHFSNDRKSLNFIVGLMEVNAKLKNNHKYIKIFRFVINSKVAKRNMPQQKSFLEKSLDLLGTI